MRRFDAEDIYKTGGADVRINTGVFRFTPSDEIRENIYRIQTETFSSGKCWSAMGVVAAELTEALRSLGYQLPNPQLTRQSQAFIMRPQEIRVWNKQLHPRFRRLECAVGKDCRDALIDHYKKVKGKGFTEAVHNLLMSRIGVQPPPYMYQQRTHMPQRVRAKPEKPAKDTTDYDSLFLQLCKERAARDSWHRKGGRSPSSTVDDHLGRTRGAFDPDKVARDKNSYNSRDK